MKEVITVTIAISSEAQQSLAGRHDVDGLLHVLYDTLNLVSTLDPDLFHCHTSAGRAVVALAESARAAAATVGTEPTAPLVTAPGVVVVRDLVAAVSRLEVVASRRDGWSGVFALRQATRRANAAYGRLLLSVPAATDRA